MSQQSNDTTTNQPAPDLSIEEGSEVNNNNNNNNKDTDEKKKKKKAPIQDGRRQLVARVGKEVTSTIRDMFDKQRDGIWRLWREGEDGFDAWDLLWEDRTYPTTFHQHVQRNPHKRLNHFSRAINAVTRKDDLCVNIRLFVASYRCAPLYSFAPRSFVVPKERAQFCKYAKKLNQIEDESQVMAKMFIFKPASANRGKGIYVFNRIMDLVQDEKTSPIGVVQRYVQYPCLIDGYKFDLRLYVLLADAWPPEIYLHQRGLVRISSQRYDVSQFSNPFQHLTNSSVTKTNKDMSAEEERDGVIKPEVGWKWSLPQLWEYLRNHSVYGPLFDQQRLWKAIENLVVLTLLPLVGKVPHEGYGYELLGFDVLLDAKLKCWLMEVNRSPAMRVYWPADKQCKNPMVNDLFRMLKLDRLNPDVALNHGSSETKPVDPSLMLQNRRRAPPSGSNNSRRGSTSKSAASSTKEGDIVQEEKKEQQVYIRQEHDIDPESCGLFQKLLPFDSVTTKLCNDLKRHKFEYGDKPPSNAIVKPFIQGILAQLSPASSPTTAT